MNKLVIKDNKLITLNNQVLTENISTNSDTIALVTVYYTPGNFCTCTDGETVLISDNTNGIFGFSIPNMGEWIISDTVKTKTIIISDRADNKIIRLNYGFFYNKLLYIEDDTRYKQFVDTGVCPNNILIGTDIKFEVLSTKSDSWVYGNYNGDNSQNYLIGYYNGKPNVQLFGTTSTATTSWVGIHTVKININNKTIFDNELLIDHNIFGRKQSGGNLRLFDSHSIRTSSIFNAWARIYYCKIYQNDILIKDLIPVERKSDGELGFYDIINDDFLINTGSGQLIKGPYIE